MLLCTAQGGGESLKVMVGGVVVYDLSKVRIRDHIAKLSASRMEIRPLMERISRINRGNRHVLQIFDPAAVKSRMHLEAAFLNVLAARNANTVITDSMSMEMLLCMASTRQIGEALSTAGAKTNREFVLFSDSKEAYARISKYLVKPRDLKVAGGSGRITSRVSKSRAEVMQSMLLPRLRSG